jgi:hypothetical protein
MKGWFPASFGKIGLEEWTLRVTVAGYHNEGMVPRKFGAIYLEERTLRVTLIGYHNEGMVPRKFWQNWFGGVNTSCNRGWLP